MVRLSRAWTPLAVVAVALLVAVTPAAAATNTGAVINTTAADFNAGTLSGDVGVVGSGESANVELGVGAAYEDFERASPLNDYGGNTGGFSITGTAPIEGSNSLEADTVNPKTISSTSGLTYPDQGDTFSAKLEVASGARAGFFWATQQADATPGGYRVVLQDDVNQWILQERTTAGGGGSLDTAPVDIIPGDTYRVEVEWQNDGTMTATLINESNGGSTHGTVSFTDTTFTDGGIGWVSDKAAGSKFDDYRPEATETGTYISANHSVDNPINGFTDLTLSNTEAVVTWQEFTGGSWSTIDQTTYTTSGNHSVSLAAASSSTLRVNVTFTATDSSFTGELHDEGVTFTNHAPEFDNSSASPSGGSELSSSPITLSINMTDTEFGRPQVDAVDVEFFVNSTSVGTTSGVTSNGTVTFDYTPTIGGDREWYAVATDSYGGQNTSATFMFTVPSQLQIREETSPHAQITGATATVKFFENTQDDPTIVERTTTDGNISLAGLPINTEFVASVKAAGYHNRTVIIKDIFDQNTVFLLNDSRTAVNNTFTLDVGVGDFTPDDGVRFFIQKAINQSEYDTGGWAWITVSGDNMGAAQAFRDTLEYEDRYRLRIENDDGDSRTLGEYNAEQSGLVTLTVSSVVLTPTEGTTYGWNATFNESGSNFVRFEFNDPERNTTGINMTIYEYGNRSNVFATDLNNAGPFGSFSFAQQATGQDANRAWVVEWNATKNGTAIGGSDVVGRQTIGPDLPIDDVWLEVIAVGFLVLMAGAVGGVASPGAGAMVLALFGGMFWQLGFLPSEIGGGAIVLAILVAATWFVNDHRVEP